MEVHTRRGRLNQRKYLEAFKRGYKVTEEGQLVSPSGKNMKSYSGVTVGKGRPRFSCSLGSGSPKYDLSVIDFAALCHFGGAVFLEQCRVVSLNERGDISKAGLALQGVTKAEIEQHRTLKFTEVPDAEGGLGPLSTLKLRVGKVKDV